MRGVRSAMVYPVVGESELVKLLEKHCKESDSPPRAMVEAMFESLNIDPGGDDEECSADSVNIGSDANNMMKGKLQ